MLFTQTHHIERYTKIALCTSADSLCSQLAMYMNCMDDDNDMKEDSPFVDKQFFAVSSSIAFLWQLQTEITYHGQ